MSRRIEEADFTKTKALPAAAGSIYTDDIDLGANRSADAIVPEGVEVEVSVPALDATELPNGETTKISILAGAAAAPTTIIMENVLVQTGAGGVGAAAQTKRLRLPADCARYVRAGATGSTTIGDQSGVLLTYKFLF